MKIQNLTQADNLLRQYVPVMKQNTGLDLSLDRMWPALKALGNPHHKLKVIHIAGTSGKTSTAYYTAALLHASGQKVGLSVSPHVISIAERVQIDGQTIGEQQFCALLGEFLDIVLGVGPKPSYFELLVMFGLWVFERQKVDYAVLETGLGGLLDATNVVTSGDKVCVITDIGLDHTRVLGDTLDKIAAQKAGIIHRNNDVFIYSQASLIMDAVQSRIDQQEAQLHNVNNTLHVNNMENWVSVPLFQQRNYRLAESVCSFIGQRDGFELQSVNPMNVLIPGRMETIKLHDGSVLILDGAHNAQKVQAFLDSFIELYPNQKASVLLGVKKGKQYQEILDIIMPITDSLIVTTASASQDLPVPSQNPELIAEHARQKGLHPIVIPDNQKAYEELIRTQQHIKLVIGSFFLVNKLKRSGLD